MSTISPSSLFKKNPLLHNPEVGKQKESAFLLPALNHTYGISQIRDPYGVKELTSNWDYHNKSQTKEDNKDYISLNKLSASQGLHDAKNHVKFLKEHDIRVKKKRHNSGYEIQLPIEEFRYGKISKPQTPIGQIIQYKFANEMEARNVQFYRNRLSSLQQYVEKQPKEKILRSLDVRNKYVKEKYFQEKSQKNPLFKLSRFQLIEKRTSSFRK